MNELMSHLTRNKNIPYFILVTENTLYSIVETLYKWKPCCTHQIYSTCSTLDLRCSLAYYMKMIFTNTINKKGKYKNRIETKKISIAFNVLLLSSL